MKRVVTTILATVALVSVVFVAAATAHTVKYESTVTVKFKKAAKDPAIFDGAVSATTPRCEGNRKVDLRLRAADGTSTVVGTDLTDPAGAWAFQPTADVAPGDYFAQVAKKVLRKDAKHRHVCKKAVSGDVTVK